MDALTKKTARNSSYSTIAFIWPILLAFFVTPFIVHALGTEQYGIYSLVIAFVGFFGFLDLGIAPSLVKYVSEYNARKDDNAINLLFNSALFLYLTIGIMAAFLIAGFGRFYAPDVWKTSAENAPLLQTVLYIAAIGFLINMVLTAFSALPSALQRFDITSKINLVVTTISTGLTVLLLLAGEGLVAIVALGIFTSLAALLVYHFINRRLLPALRLKPHIDRKMLKLVLVFGGYATIGTLASVILLQLDKFIIGATLGASAVAFYVIPGNLAVKIHGTISALTAIIFPLSSELFATGNLERLHSLYFRATRLVLTFITVAVTPMYVFAHPFLLHWIGVSFAQNSTLVMQLLLATYSILSLTAIPFFVLYGAGKPKMAALFSVISGVLNVALILILIPRFGINGAAFAYLLSVLPCILFVRYVEKKVLRLSVRAFYVGIGPRLMVLFGAS
ncbi:MAG TPA: flippase, partial [Candidatus Saccharimonadia bacterium]